MLCVVACVPLATAISARLGDDAQDELHQLRLIVAPRKTDCIFFHADKGREVEMDMQVREEQTAKKEEGRKKNENVDTLDDAYATRLGRCRAVASQL